MALLFEPFRIRDVSLPNRVMISPMCQYSADAAGHASDWHLAHYGRFAMGGAGLVVVEATSIVPQGRLSYGDLGIWSDDHVAGLARVAAFIRSQGSTPGIQIAHAGRKACTQRPWHGNGPLGQADMDERGEVQWPLESVTTEPAGEGHAAPRALTVDDISSLMGEWAAAARRAREAGFEVVEIHGAHGYLVHSFLSPLSNTRADGYGGGLEGRMRFAVEAARAVRTQWPVELPLFFRISALDAARDGWSLDDSVVLARALAAEGVDLIDCSSGGIGADYSIIPRGPGFQVSFADHVRAKAGIPTAAVGLITDAGQAEAILAGGHADLVAIGREAMFNPNWPVQARLALLPERRFSDWPPQAGWWLQRRKLGQQSAKR